MIALIRQAKSKEIQVYVLVMDASKISGYKQQYLRRSLRQENFYEEKQDKCGL